MKRMIRERKEQDERERERDRTFFLELGKLFTNQNKNFVITTALT